jgi:hypothetical protein
MHLDAAVGRYRDFKFALGHKNGWWIHVVTF